MLKRLLLIFIITLYSCLGIAKDVKYSVEIDSYNNRINGKEVQSFLLNNGSPGPVIKANIGDDLSVTFNNKTNKDMVIHWHGVMLPNSQDGVAGVTQSPIAAGKSFTYNFRVKQTGTYWYHAHGLEEAQGIYGGIVFGDKDENLDNERVLIYSGQLSKNPEDVLADLTGGSNSMNHMNHMSNNQDKSNQGMNHENMDHSMMNDESPNSSSTCQTNMENSAMSNSSMSNCSAHMNHFSDVSYAMYLINNQENPFYIRNVKDNKVKLRIINAYVDGFINLVYSGGDIEIVAADGLPVKPIKVDHLRIAMGETYDIVLDVKNKQSYELVSFFMGEDAYSKVIVGNGNLVPLSSLKATEYNQDQVYPLLETLTPVYLDFNKFKSVENHEFALNGNHDKYNWSIEEQGKVLKDLNVKVGDKIKVKIINNTMMPHPMHLHGTFFKVTLNNSSNNLIKHTINLDPMESIEIEFIIDEEGKWLFHCHNLFHMASGMMIVINASQ